MKIGLVLVGLGLASSECSGLEAFVLRKYSNNDCTGDIETESTYPDVVCIKSLMGASFEASYQIDFEYGDPAIGGVSLYGDQFVGGGSSCENPSSTSSTQLFVGGSEDRLNNCSNDAGATIITKETVDPKDFFGLIEVTSRVLGGKKIDCSLHPRLSDVIANTTLTQFSQSFKDSLMTWYKYGDCQDQFFLSFIAFKNGTVHAFQSSGCTGDITVLNMDCLSSGQDTKIKVITPISLALGSTGDDSTSPNSATYNAPCFVMMMVMLTNFLFNT